MKKLFFSAVIIFQVLILFAQNPKYIFLFIGDGMSFPQRMIAEEFSKQTGRGVLAMNTLPVHATTRTASANALITDSAAAGTAIACGSKTNNYVIGLAPDGKRLTSVAEIAREKGKKVGIISTVNINHATPASFYGHRSNRSQYYDLGLDLVASGFDFFGGGGIIHCNKGNKSILDLAAAAGYKVVEGRKGLNSMTSGSKYIALANGRENPMSYFVSRRDSKTIPALPEIVAKAIEILDNRNGFFIMTEGGAIDWAGHANEAAANIHDILEFDAAIKVALKFYRKHPGETLIIVTGDHETGGMTMGFAGSGNYMNLKLFDDHTASIADFQNQLKKMRKNNPGLQFDDVKPLMSKCFGFKFKNYTSGDKQGISVKELTALKKAFAAKRLSREVSNVINRKAGIGWASGAHTALPVLTTSIGCKSEKFSGFIENTDIANTLKSLL